MEKTEEIIYYNYFDDLGRKSSPFNDWIYPDGWLEREGSIPKIIVEHTSSPSHIIKLENFIEPSYLSLDIEGPTINIANSKKQAKEPKAIPFLLYLTPDGQNILSELKTFMNEATKPVDFAIMLFALQDLELLHHEKVINIKNVSELHRSLKHTFGHPHLGKLFTLRKNIFKIEKGLLDQELRIKAASAKIKELLVQNKEGKNE